MVYNRGKQIKVGGEGTIYEVDGFPNLLMKIYKEKDYEGNPIVTSELEAKLAYMKEHPPVQLIEQQLIAWPLELIYESGEFIGFIMPRLEFDVHVQRIYVYQHPLHNSGDYNNYPSTRSRIAIAANLCSMLYELHHLGYVIGDFNDQNIGIRYTTGQVYMVDCDSFHITRENGEVLRTNVIMPGYLAPEIIKHCNDERVAGRESDLDKVSLPTFTVESDLFCLAIHIFKLLMNGIDPYRGVSITGSTASPFTGNEAIERNGYVFRPGNKPSAVFCPKINSLPPEIIQLFDRAFLDSRTNPKRRPMTTEWYQSLTGFLEKLSQCLINPKHQYYHSLIACPYCKADENYSNAFYEEPDISLKPVDAPMPIPAYEPVISTNQPTVPLTTLPKKRSRFSVVIAFAAGIIATILIGRFLLNNPAVSEAITNISNRESSNLVLAESGNESPEESIDSESSEDYTALQETETVEQTETMPSNTGFSDDEIALATEEEDSVFITDISVALEPPLENEEPTQAPTSLAVASESPTEALTTTPSADNGDFILSSSSTHVLTDADLNGLSIEELRIARNEIYARYGRQFNDEILQEYFNGKSWYAAIQKLPKGTEPTLTKLELSNIDLIKVYEAR